MDAPEQITAGYDKGKRQAQFMFLDPGGEESWLDASDGPPAYARITVQFARDGSDKIVGVSLESAKALTPSECQRFPWSKWMTAADAMCRTQGHPEPEALWTALGEPPAAKRPGRRGHGNAFYEGIARRYLELRAEGVTNPTTTIMREHGPGYPRATVAGWVKQCRRRNLLPPARGNRAG